MSLAKPNKKSKKVNNEEDDHEELNEIEEQQEMEDQFEAALVSKGGTNIWQSGGVRKDVAIRGLITCFGSMVESFPSSDAIPDHRGRYQSEDLVYNKLLDASKQVIKAKTSV
jgi:hypothetical protein